METQKVLILAIVTIISVAIALSIQQFFYRKAKSRLESANINFALALIFVSWASGFFILNGKTISILDEYVDMIFKVAGPEGWLTIAKTSVVFIAILNLWIIIVFFLTRVLMQIFYSKRNRAIEAANNNYPYFLIEGVILVGLIWSFIPIFETILRIFFPVEVPFYR